MIRFDDVRKDYGSFTALHPMHFHLPEGAFCALLGPNGAGKTTWMRLLMGLLNPSSGHIQIDGKRLNANRTELLRNIGYVPQRTNLDKTLPGLQCAEFHARVYGLSASWRRRCDELATLLKLDKHMYKPTGALSGGMKRKLILLLSLLHDPRLIVLDEPTVGIDAANRREIWEMLRLQQGHGKTLVISTHSMEEAQYLAPRIAILHQGHLLANEELSSLTSRTLSENLEEAYLHLTTYEPGQPRVKL